MTGWIQKKQEFANNKNYIYQDSNVELILSEIRKADNEGNSRNKNKFIHELQSVLTSYRGLYNRIQKYLNISDISTSLTTQLEENTTFQQNIKRLETQNESLKVDVESALAREELLRTRDTHINPHTLFILNRPVRKDRIPYLWLFSIFLVGIGLYLLRLSFPQMEATGLFNILMENSVSYFGNNSHMLIILGVAFLITISAFLLKMYKVF
jgi:hypothetical protein